MLSVAVAYLRGEPTADRHRGVWPQYDRADTLMLSISNDAKQPSKVLAIK